MPRAFTIALVGLLGCGRVGFDLAGDGGASADTEVADVRIDGPSQFGQVSGTSAGRALATAPNGDLIVVGWLTEPIDLGGGALPHVAGRDVMVARYSASGEHRWSRSIGSAADDSALDVDTDAAGNIYVVGTHSGPIDFGGGVVPVTSDIDGFVLALTGTGAYRWSRKIDSTVATALDAGWAVATSADRVFVSGLTLAPVSTGGPLLNCGGSSQAAFVTAYGLDGGYLWGSCWGAGGFNSARGLAVDGAGNVSITGYYSGTASFGAEDLPAATGLDLFIASYDRDGNYRWARGFGGGGDDWGNRIDTDAAGNVFATGFFTGTTIFDSVGGTSLTASGSIDGYVASYTSAGGFRWAQRFGGGTCDQLRGVTVGPTGDVYVVGAFEGSAVFGSTT